MIRGCSRIELLEKATTPSNCYMSCQLDHSRWRSHAHMPMLLSNSAGDRHFMIPDRPRFEHLGRITGSCFCEHAIFSLRKILQAGSVNAEQLTQVKALRAQPRYQDSLHTGPSLPRGATRSPGNLAFENLGRGKHCVNCLHDQCQKHDFILLMTYQPSTQSPPNFKENIKSQVGNPDDGCSLTSGVFSFW